ncbi:uncharacterized protein LOC119607149 [Lucilia sericata]|uniref:uncharacterized protein LOC119607149 n=1 Tax=Lucilia sericata TaxID=13632 RepID=UPI0018A8511B|nr:uncharacterized protein LOC119607149 [Lucilia sericata]
MFLLKLQFLIIIVMFGTIVSPLSSASALCIGTLPASCLTELSEEEANETLKYVISKYEEVEMKIIGEPVSIYGLRLSYGDTEEELNIHFKYIDNTQQDIIQNCVFALYHRQNECELIKTICNTFLPITPRPLLQRKDLRICDDGSDVQLVEKEDNDEGEETTMVTTTDTKHVASRTDNDAEGSDNDDDEKDQLRQSAQQRSTEAESY